MIEKSYENSLEQLRALLKKRRGWGGRVSRRLNIERHHVYKVADGVKKDPDIMKALIEDIEEGKTEKDPKTESIEILSEYLKGTQ